MIDEENFFGKPIDNFASRNKMKLELKTLEAVS